MTTEKVKNELTYAERLDIPQVTLAEAKEQILLSLNNRQRRGCIVLVGEAGLGKTQIIHQICQEQKYSLKPIHSAHFGLMGAGIPRKAEGEFFNIAVPSIFPKKGEKSIVLFDEWNRGKPHAIAMFFNMLEDGTMFNYKLPDECLVVGTMNPDTTGYSVTSIENEAAMRRRIKFLYVVPEFSGWYEHAKTDQFHAESNGPSKNKPCHPEILAYFKAHPKILHDGKARDAGRQYICPATIETLSEDAYNLDAAEFALDGDIARVRFAASVGLTGVAQMQEFIKDSTVILHAADVVLKYTKKTRKAVAKLRKQSQQEKLADLCENVLTLMFAEKNNVKKTAPNFLNFCTDLPDELSANMLFQLKESAVQANARPYLDSLMNELQDHDAWIELNKTLDANHRKLDSGLRS